MTDLFADANSPGSQPLAARLRPRHVDEVVGQEHLLGQGRPLRLAIETGKLFSMILWGPPGVGKTTLARLLADRADARFMGLSALTSGVKDIRAVVEQAQLERSQCGRQTLLFVDEVHRFNKSQQDGFLPFIEDGTLIFVGATTENPSFALNNALLSRCKVQVLQALDVSRIKAVLQRGLSLLEPTMVCTEVQLDWLARAADGDARRALNLLELTHEMSLAEQLTEVSDSLIERVVEGGGVRRFDRGGDEFYDQISALHKSVRGSDVDASLYWLCRMLDGGCDPDYILRRMVRMASEDIGNADPRALGLVLEAWQAYERLGSPEGELALAQASIYLAIAAKSNATYTAWNRVQSSVRELGSLPVPLHLRNAATRLMRELDYGKGYRYAHDENEHYAAGERYLPEGMAPQGFYQPSDQGQEQRIAERLARLAQLDQKHRENMTS